MTLYIDGDTFPKLLKPIKYIIVEQGADTNEALI